MDLFQLTEDGIWLYLSQRESIGAADRVVTEIFKGLYKLAENPNTGHYRADLTTRPVLFYRVFSYLAVYVPGPQPLQVLGVPHGKRNVSRILKQRRTA